MQKSHEKLWHDGVECLKTDPVLKRWVEKIPPPEGPLENYMSAYLAGEDSLRIYFALVRAIVAQQLSTASAKAILQRVQKLGDTALPLPEIFLKEKDEVLRECGLSRQKITYLRAVAQRANQNLLPSPEEALAMGVPKLREILTEIPGIGDWSADMVMIFALHHPDIFAVGDYGVREGYRLIYALDKQPTPKHLAKEGEKFSPYRSLLTWYCWQVKELMQIS